MVIDQAEHAGVYKRDYAFRGQLAFLHLTTALEYDGYADFLHLAKEATEFVLDYMVEDPKRGWLVTGPSTSPENAFLTPSGQGACIEYMGPTCDIVLSGLPKAAP